MVRQDLDTGSRFCPRCQKQLMANWKPLPTQPTAEKSDTPRTDAAEVIRENGGDVSDVFAAMRQLERELNEAKSLNETLERSNRRLRQQVKP